MIVHYNNDNNNNNNNNKINLLGPLKGRDVKENAEGSAEQQPEHSQTF